MDDAKRKTIFMVDDNLTNLTVGKSALLGRYKVFTIPSGKKLFEMLNKTTPDMILLDIEMPDMNGYEIIRELKANIETAHIPVIFLTARSDSGSELEGLSLGAIDYISKPFSPPLLLKRIEVHMLVEEQKKELENYNDNLQFMVDEKTKTVLDLQNAILKTVAELVECRDDTTGGHIERTQNYLRILIDALLTEGIYKEQVSGWNIEFLLQSSQLHDVGKIAIKDCILQKPAKLTEEEFNEMKTHTLFGIKVIERIQENTTEATFLEYAKIFASTHHEKWDGSGYPHGLKGEEIPLQGRLMAIADVYDALISERPYKQPFPHEEAVSIIRDGSGSHFDPYLVEVFLKHEQDFREVAVNLGGGEQNACRPAEAGGKKEVSHD
ncbi:MAG: response regulator [Chitinispirillales bacterium]|jgi:putative two-component system response regulator|nr:response regulator [Chitinispirillales bacterium]